ncbi:MAG: hypothetical protein OXN97_17845 [Bryobacterales bacterium]|nr:hypothetical protein [Bryobacterales bacterium]
MSEQEQDRHLGELLVEQRRLRRSLACLKSKIERISEKLKAAVESNHVNFKHRHNDFLKVGGGDLSRYMKEYKDGLERKGTLDRQIREIDGYE